MARGSQKRWQGFEELAHRILSEFAPFANVTLDDRIIGGDSGTYRQIDVSLKWTFEGRELLTIVQAKDWKAKADVKVVDAFRSVIQDVRATQGILICSAGFSKNALQYARRIGIECYNLHDASSLNWSQQLAIPLLWTDTSPIITPAFTVPFEAGDSLVEDPADPKYHKFVLSPDDGSTVVDWLGTFEQMWNDGKLDRSGGETRGIYDERPFFLGVLDKSGKLCWRPVNDFRVSYEVERRSWLGSLKPAGARGIINLLDNSAFTPTYLRIEDFPREPHVSWKRVPDPDSLAVQIRGAFFTSERFQISGPPIVERFGLEYFGP
ncbi:MAG TPA: restriction endonuclease [Pilimelia sp.]|nr:restriction endonuclease [Pilimelia sp.]